MAYLSEYTEKNITDFMGLYKRGMADECPIDHAICCENVTFREKGEFSTRGGVAVSYSLGWRTVRFFYGLTNNVGHLLTLDPSGNIYADNNPTPIWSDANIIDFQCINLFNRVYILPITAGNAAFLLVWDGTNPARLAAGLGPTTGVSAATGGSGNVDPGVHQIGVCFVTNTGFITRPGQDVGGVFTPTIYNAPGGASIDLTGIPTGGSDVVARYIVVTQANQTLFFFCPGGLINDNTTTTLTINFYDTDLLLSADYLFDEYEKIPAATVAGALYTYHSRLFIAPGNNTALVSDPSDPETFDEVDGVITLPNPGYNTIRAFCQLYDTLYLVKSTGIVSTYDNGNLPSTWSVIEVDETHGGFQPAISNISVTSVALSENQMFLLCDLGGIFVFNGAMSSVPLTWKIDDLWQTISNIGATTIVTDPFKQVFYVNIATNSSTTANVLLVGDFTLGIDPMKIKWTIFTFPFTPQAIGMLNFNDGSDSVYCLRITANENNFMFKYGDPSNPPGDYGTNIMSYYQTYLGAFELGKVNLFRVMRFRARGSGSLYLTLFSEDLQNSFTVTPVPLVQFPAKDYLREINYKNEKMSIVLANGPNPTDVITIQRVDIYGKRFAYARPA